MLRNASQWFTCSLCELVTPSRSKRSQKHPALRYFCRERIRLLKGGQGQLCRTTRPESFQEEQPDRESWKQIRQQDAASMNKPSRSIKCALGIDGTLSVLEILVRPSP